MDKIDDLLYLAGPTLTGILALILIHRKVYNQFPFFSLYAYCSVLIEITRLAVAHYYQTYFKVYWLTEAVYVVLALLALHEIFRRVFMAFYVELWFKLLFPEVVLLVSLFTSWQVIYHPPFQASRLIAVILLFGLAVSFIKAAIFCMLMGVASMFKLGWRTAPLGIALGFAATAAGGLAAYWTRSEFGTKVEVLAKYVVSGFNILAIAVWLDTFLRPDPEPQWSDEVTPRLVAKAIRRERTSFEDLTDNKDDRHN